MRMRRNTLPQSIRNIRSPCVAAAVTFPTASTRGTGLPIHLSSRSLFKTITSQLGSCLAAAYRAHKRDLVAVIEDHVVEVPSAVHQGHDIAVTVDAQVLP